MPVLSTSVEPPVKTHRLTETGRRDLRRERGHVRSPLRSRRWSKAKLPPPCAPKVEAELETAQGEQEQYGAYVIGLGTARRPPTTC
jgi:hypothetical protein